MKTADLIPFILIELNEREKYGFELTKDIETKSGGKIVIKQPTLYTVLKKLEKSRFISSYWQDSEIGGKRHYYKITENGKMQLATLPSYDFLLQHALEDETLENDEVSENNAKEPFSNEESTLPTTPIETVLPTEEVFKENSIDTLTEQNINQANADILKDEETKSVNSFAENKNIAKFTEKIEVPVKEVKTETKIEDKNNILDLANYSIANNNETIKFVEYKNIKHSNEYKQSKKYAQAILFKSLLTSVTILLFLTLFSFITSFTGTSALYYVFFISSLLIAIFYPIIVSMNLEKLRYKYINSSQLFDYKKQFIIVGAIIACILVVCLIVNISMNYNTLPKMLSVYNFENIYAPIILSLILVLNVVYDILFTKKLKK